MAGERHILNGSENLDNAFQPDVVVIAAKDSLSTFAADVDTASARGLAVATRAAAKPQPPKKPRTLYRWKDSRGVPHMTETPPSDGAYETLRSSD